MIYVPLPCKRTRREILKVGLLISCNALSTERSFTALTVGCWPQLQFQKTPTDQDVNIEELVTQTESYSGAEVCGWGIQTGWWLSPPPLFQVVSLCQEAGLCALHESLTAEVVHRRHFKEALQVVKPRTDTAMLQFYAEYQASFRTADFNRQ